MSPFRSLLARSPKPITRRRPLRVEALESRDVPATLSIGDAIATEGGGMLKSLDRFVAAGSGLSNQTYSPVFGPDGNHDGAQDLYVGDQQSSSILRFDGATGAYIDTFVPSGSGGLNGPIDHAFGPDGSLYVTSRLSNQILHYDGSTGAFLGVVVSNLNNPIGITFGPEGSLFIANRNANEVLRYSNGVLSTFVPAGSGGVALPRRAVFGPDGNGDGAPDLYVASEGSGRVLRYDGLTGAFVDTFVTPGSAQGPMWLEFGADGILYVTARMTSGSLNMTFLRYNSATGAFLNSLALDRDGWSFSIGPGNIIYDSPANQGSFIDRFGPSSIAAFPVTLSSPVASTITVDYSTADGTALADSDYATTTRTLTFAPGQTSRTILVPTINDDLPELPDTFTVTLSNASGAIIGNAVGTGTITDDDVTKFFVVDDGGTDRTYRYGVPGNSLATSTLGSGDTAPRGVASTAAGNKVWVVDANKTVYVYNPSGILLGSWAAGSLAANAQVEGLATNG
ncbi:MAG: Calx-beta domain-containing protein, partial [Gemmataceae bacterium]